jgi:hypothetical protein
MKMMGSQIPHFFPNQKYSILNIFLILPPKVKIYKLKFYSLIFFRIKKTLDKKRIINYLNIAFYN